jgi:hypothetical protein
MADITKIQRSRDRISEILHYLTNSHRDEKTDDFINNLQLSIKVIDNKLEEYKERARFKNQVI